jgi:hypothetical protein
MAVGWSYLPFIRRCDTLAVKPFGARLAQDSSRITRKPSARAQPRLPQEVSYGFEAVAAALLRFSVWVPAQTSVLGSAASFARKTPLFPAL